MSPAFRLEGIRKSAEGEPWLLEGSTSVTSQAASSILHRPQRKSLRQRRSGSSLIPNKHMNARRLNVGIDNRDTMSRTGDRGRQAGCQVGFSCSASKRMNGNDPAQKTPPSSR